MGLSFPQYISTKERTVSIVGYIDTTKEYTKEELQDGKGYIDVDGYIWIYNAGGKPKNANIYPYFWLNESKLEFSNPDEVTKKMYNTDRLVDMSLINIVNTTEPGEVLFDEEEINDIISAASLYKPEIKESDDFLKKLIKYTIIQKKININRLKNKTDEKYMLPNMKAALNNGTKTSVLYFAIWMDLLGCDFEITILDSGNDNVDPLKHPIVYESSKGRISDVINGELVESTVANNYKEESEEKDDEE